MSTDIIAREIIERLRSLSPLQSMRIVNSLIISNNMSLENEGGSAIPLKLLLALPHVYASCAVARGHQPVDYAAEVDAISSLMVGLAEAYAEQLDQGNRSAYGMSSPSTTYLRYQMDYPSMSFEQYITFLRDNSAIVSEMYSEYGLSGEDIARGLVLLAYLEPYCWGSLIDSLICRVWLNYDRDLVVSCIDSIGNRQDLFTAYPIALVRRLLRDVGVDSERFLSCFFDEVQFDDLPDTVYLTERDSNLMNSLGIVVGKHLYFPRSYFVLDRVYNYIIGHDLFQEKKAVWLEARCRELLVELFGENCVFSQVYDQDGNEQDILVVAGSRVLVFECKSVPLREPFRTAGKAKIRLDHNFAKSLQVAYDQSTRVFDRIGSSSAVYYDSDRKSSRKVVVDLSRYEANNVHLCLVTAGRYLDLGTEIHETLLRRSDSYPMPWAVDIFVLEQIIRSLVRGQNSELLTDFLSKRVKLYGSVFSANADELSLFGFLRKHGEFPPVSSASHSFAILGYGYSTFVTEPGEETAQGIEMLKDLRQWRRKERHRHGFQLFKG